ncbi:MAG: adenylate kinase [Parachlamydiaceae bacterium]
MMQTLPSKKIVLLLGPPGSGKGTQALTLAKDLGIPHISTGDLFRENIRLGTPLGLKVKTSIEAGKLVSDEIVLEMLFNRVKATDCEHGFLLDGFPRTLAQAEALAKTIDQKNLIVFNLSVSDEMITKRAEGRLTCRSCGHIHNKYYSPPKLPNQCDKCGGELYQRVDDTLSVVQERLRIYHSQSKPLIDFYIEKQLLTNVDGEKSRDAVYHDLKRAYEEKDSLSR